MAHDNRKLMAARTKLLTRCPARGSLWEHVRTQNLYRVVSPCIIEATLAPAVMYTEHNVIVLPDNFWVRPLAEFLDGRFREVASPEPSSPNAVAPVRPADVPDAGIPPEVIEIFNRLIREKMRPDGAVVSQSEVLAAVSDRLGISQVEVVSRRLLDVESLYMAAGWHVEYQSPDRGETGISFFRFRKRR